MLDLFTGTGIAHSILLFAFVIASGLFLGKFKIKGISIGSTWILFVGIIMSHFGFVSDPTVLAFMKDFGLILFVFAIGLQVGPGFFRSFRSGGVTLNLLAVLLVVLAVLTTVAIHLISGENMKIMTGVMSAAVTNTPGLGAAQQTLSDAIASGATSPEIDAADLGSAYAVAYPLGVLLVIFLIIASKSFFKIDLDKEQNDMKTKTGGNESARRMHLEVANPAIYGKKVSEIMVGKENQFVVSRMMRNGEIFTPEDDTIFQKGDKVMVVTTQPYVDNIRLIFGKEIPMHLSDWEAQVAQENIDIQSSRLLVSNSRLTGKTLRALDIRHRYNVTVTRIYRSGINLVAGPDSFVEVGDTLRVVGSDEGIRRLAQLVGNKAEELNRPNLVPIFFGIVLGVILGSIPIAFPGIPQPVKLGLAGGPLIVAILLGYFGPKWRITTYTTMGANLMIREIGISFFMAAVGLGAGENFVESIVNGGYWWILYGAVITIVPVTLVMLIARLFLHLNFYQITGLISGGTTDPAVLSFAQGMYGTDYTSINYATVYPLTMFMRVLAAQLLILFAL
jgi:putative transport protein